MVGGTVLHGQSRIRAALAQMGLKQTTNGLERWVQNTTEQYSLVTAVLTARAWLGLGVQRSQLLLGNGSNHRPVHTLV